MALAADVGDLADEIVRQFLLDDEVPVLVGQILAVAVDGLGAEELVLGIEERRSADTRARGNRMDEANSAARRFRPGR